jgi:hypothetical protein
MNEPIDFEQPTASPEALVAAVKALEQIRSRSFSERHPELGKMIKCQICSHRHRSSIKCEQKFKELYIEEDLETGEKTTIYAVAAQPEGTEIVGQISAEQPTQKQIVGAAMFKGKRLKPHINHKQLLFIERVRKLMAQDETLDLKEARATASRQLRREFSRRANGFRRVQDISRRINRGLV